MTKWKRTMDTTSRPGAPNAPTNTDLTIGEADAVLTLSEADIVSTPDEAAPSCGFSADTINKAIASGTLAAVRYARIWPSGGWPICAKR